MPETYKLATAITDPKFLEFLEAQRPRTAKSYATYLRKLMLFSSESGEEMLASKEVWERKISLFDKWLRKQYSDNFSEACTGMLRGFFSFYRKPLVLTSMEKKGLRDRDRTTEDFYLTGETLYKLWIVGNKRSRMIVALAKSIGQRSEDFSAITYGKLRSIDLDAEVPISFPLKTSKEKVTAYCFLDGDAVSAIKEFLEATKDKADSEAIVKDPNTLSPLIRRLAETAKLEIPENQNLRFHCFRKFLFDNLNSVMSLEKAKQIIGKKISEGAYLSPQTLREDFINVLPKIVINGNGIKKKVSELEIENAKLRNRVIELEQEQKTNTSERVSMQSQINEIMRLIRPDAQEDSAKE